MVIEAVRAWVAAAATAAVPYIFEEQRHDASKLLVDMPGHYTLVSPIPGVLHTSMQCSPVLAENLPIGSEMFHADSSDSDLLQSPDLSQELSVQPGSFPAPGQQHQFPAPGQQHQFPASGQHQFPAPGQNQFPASGQHQFPAPGQHGFPAPGQHQFPAAQRFPAPGQMPAHFAPHTNPASMPRRNFRFSGPRFPMRGGMAHEIPLSQRMGELYLNPPRPGCPYGNCGTILGFHDVVGLSFYVACNMMLAFTIFFFVQVGAVVRQWRTCVTLAGCVTGIAWHNYIYMKSQWVRTQVSPTVYRYTDWFITVPILVICFFYILQAAGKPPALLGLKMFSASFVMLFCGYLSEMGIITKPLGFLISCSSYYYIIWQVWSGEAAFHATKLKSFAAKQAFGTVRVIMWYGWSIYPIGYLFGYLLESYAGPGFTPYFMAALNITYNVADLINKGGFGLCLWQAAIMETKERDTL